MTYLEPRGPRRAVLAVTLLAALALAPQVAQAQVTSAPRVDILNASGGLNAQEIAAGVVAHVTLPPEAVAGDTLYVDTDADGVPDQTITLTAAMISAGFVDVTVDPADVPSGGNMAVSAAVQNSSGLSAIGTGNAKVDGVVPGAPVIEIQDGDGYLTVGEVQAGVNVIVTLPAGSVPGDILRIDWDGDAKADITFTLTDVDIVTGHVSFVYQTRMTTSEAVIDIRGNIKDAFGNVGPVGEDTAIIDEVAPGAPVVTIDDGGDGVLSEAEQAGGVDVTIALPAGSVAGDTVYVEYNKIDGWEHVITLTPEDVAAGSVTITIPENKIPEGSLTVTAHIEDGAHNTGPEGTDTTVIECLPDAEICDLRDNDCDGVRDGTANDQGVVVSSCVDFDNDGLSDWTETYGDIKTDPANPDTDGDGLQDGTEQGLVEPQSPKTDFAVFVPDTDPTTTTDPNDDDGDDDGLLDGTEDADLDGALDDLETDPTDVDSDDDGIQDGTELGVATAEGTDTDPAVFVPDGDPDTTTDPLDVDSDAGTVSEGIEDADHDGKCEPDDGECDPNDPTDDLNCIDTDEDGLSDGFEGTNGTDPDDDDSDDDGLGDATETNGGVTDPTNPDTDGDGIQDGTESGLTVPEGLDTASTFVADADPDTTTDPNDADTDDDGLTDGTEDANQDGAVGDEETDPNNPDTDGGTVNDGDEVANGTDPLFADDDVPADEPDQWVQGGCACDSSGTAPWLLLSLVVGLVARRRSLEVR